MPCLLAWLMCFKNHLSSLAMNPVVWACGIPSSLAFQKNPKFPTTRVPFFRAANQQRHAHVQDQEPVPFWIWVWGSSLESEGCLNQAASSAHHSAPVVACHCQHEHHRERGSQGKASAAPKSKLAAPSARIGGGQFGRDGSQPGMAPIK